MKGTGAGRGRGLRVEEDLQWLKFRISPMALSECRSSFSTCLLPGSASQCQQTSLCSSCLQAAAGEAAVKVVK